MTRDYIRGEPYKQRYPPTRVSSASTEQLVQPRGPPSSSRTPATGHSSNRYPTPSGSSGHLAATPTLGPPHLHRTSHEPSSGSSAPGSAGHLIPRGPQLPNRNHQHQDGEVSSTSQGSTHRHDMILGWLMGRKGQDRSSSTQGSGDPRVHAYRNGLMELSGTSMDASGLSTSNDHSGLSTDHTRLSRSDLSGKQASRDSSILRERYHSDSTTVPTSEHKTDSTILATDRNSTAFSTDHEIFGALASKISGSKSSLTGKENFSMSSRAASINGSTCPIIDDDNVASPEQAKQLMEKGFRQYRTCCGRCTFCKLLVMAAFLGILGLMSYGAVVGVRGALGYGSQSTSALVGENPYNNATIGMNDNSKILTDDDSDYPYDSDAENSDKPLNPQGGLRPLGPYDPPEPYDPEGRVFPPMLPREDEEDYDDLEVEGGIEGIITDDRDRRIGDGGRRRGGIADGTTAVTRPSTTTLAPVGRWEPPPAAVAAAAAAAAGNGRRIPPISGAEEPFQGPVDPYALAPRPAPIAPEPNASTPAPEPIAPVPGPIVPVIVPMPVKFVGFGVQKEECVTEVPSRIRVNEDLCRQHPNTTIGARYSCEGYMYCVEESGSYTMYECPCGQFFHPPTLTCVPQMNGVYADPEECGTYWRCLFVYPNVMRTQLHCEEGQGMELLEPGECKPQDTLSHCQLSEIRAATRHPGVPRGGP